MGSLSIHEGSERCRAAPSSDSCCSVTAAETPSLHSDRQLHEQRSTHTPAWTGSGVDCAQPADSAAIRRMQQAQRSDRGCRPTAAAVAGHGHSGGESSPRSTPRTPTDSERRCVTCCCCCCEPGPWFLFRPAQGRPSRSDEPPCPAACARIRKIDLGIER